jgi:hypothetical protein
VPHKTKKQKILAQLHRRLERVGSQELVVGSISEQEKPVVISTNYQPITNNYSYLKSGLLKTLIFSVLAISLMVVLWYVKFK